MDLQGKKLILCSASPRRRELLKGLDIDFEVDTETLFKENLSPGMPHYEIPALMSQGKSHGFHRDLKEGEILITSDTMVLCGEVALGKPHSRDEAVRMLKKLSGNEHTVVTAVTIRDAHKEETFTDTTRVHFRELDDNEIDYYLDKYRPYDKAGAYGVQEWIGYVGITGIEGSFYTVMGFPVLRVYQELQKFL